MMAQGEIVPDGVPTPPSVATPSIRRLEECPYDMTVRVLLADGGVWKFAAQDLLDMDRGDVTGSMLTSLWARNRLWFAGRRL